LYSAVAEVRYVNATVWCHCDAQRTVELPVARALRASLANEHAFLGELMDAVVAPLCNVDATVGCDRDALWVVE